MQVRDWLELSVKHNASDLHLSPGSPPILRIDGELVRIDGAPILDAQLTQKLIYSLMEQDQVPAFEKMLELDFAITFPNLASFRINVFHQTKGIAAVFRIIPEVIPTFEQLELPSLFKQLLNLKNGLIIVAGPTGSGKSTTLAAMVDHINTYQTKHIITLEDPVEFIHTNKKSLISQRQVQRDTHDFSAGLHAALREDPDVILIGEMRNLATIRLALTAAETGHLVMASLHTSSAPRTISRIIDVFPASEKNIIRNMLSESLQAVICQALCAKNTGGRVPAFEIMLGTPAIRNLIREDKVAQMSGAIQMGAAVGMCTFEQYLQRLVDKKIINGTVVHKTVT